MTSIIPAPSKITNGHGDDVALDASSWISGASEFPLPADWLRSGLERFAGVRLAESESTGTKITLRTGPVNELMPISIGVRADGGEPHSEGYVITVDGGEIIIEGMTSEAVFRGATSLIQKAALSRTGASVVIEPAQVIDAPRFAWRGLSFDVVRCFHPVDTVKKVIDLLALYKMNVLHLHLTDTEGWRFQVDNWPNLTAISGQTARDNRPGGFYTAEDYAEIVQYAADRYITVVPEFDSPGHTASVLKAYPEFAAEGILDTPEAMHYLHPDQPDVSTLLADVYAAMAAATPGDRLHIGGDEAIAMDHDTFKRYIELALPLARQTGKGVVAWQEAARGGLAEGDLLQLWIPDFLINKMKEVRENPNSGGFGSLDPQVAAAFIELLAEADKDLPLGLDQGANVVISLATWLYLDTRYTETSADPGQQAMLDRLGLPSSVYGNGTVADSFNWEPATIAPGLSTDRIAGVEGAIWCETIENADDLFFQLLPRLAGVSEKAWSEHREWDDYRARLADQPVFWDAMGLTWFRSSVVWES